MKCHTINVHSKLASILYRGTKYRGYSGVLGPTVGGLGGTATAYADSAKPSNGTVATKLAERQAAPTLSKSYISLSNCPVDNTKSSRKPDIPLVLSRYRGDNRNSLYSDARRANPLMILDVRMQCRSLCNP